MPNPRLPAFATYSVTQKHTVIRWRAVTAVSTPMCCLLPKDPELCVQALQLATSSVARAVWCGSWVMVDGMTECSGAEVADSLVWIAA